MRIRRINLTTKSLVALLLLAFLACVAVGQVTATLDEQLARAAAFADLAAVETLLDRGADVNAKHKDGWTALMSAVSGRYWTLAKVFHGLYEETALMPAFESGLSGRADVAKLLIQNGANVNAKAADGTTALMLATRSVGADVVQALLDYGADVNAKTADGTTALMYAVNSAGADVVKLLLEKGADVHARDRGGWTVLMRAARFGSGLPRHMSPLRKDTGTNTFKGDNLTHFLEAGRRRHAEVIELLKAHGAEVTLTIAAMLGDEREVRELLDKGADVNGKASDGLTALIGAAELGHAGMANLLLERGADVNAQDKEGRTAIIYAARRGHADIVKVLLDKGADVNARAADGTTALVMAAQRRHAYVVKLLLDKGADANARAADGTTALMKVAKFGTTFVGVAELLISHGAEVTLTTAAMLGDVGKVQRHLETDADVNARGRDGRTALIWAANNGHIDVARLLLDKGADVNAEDKNGWTALWAAVWMRRPDMVKLLLERGADVGTTGKHGGTLLQMAETRRDARIVGPLREYGAKK